MTTDRRKEVLAKRAEEYRNRLPIIHIVVDGDKNLSMADVTDAVAFIRGWLLKTPFWEITSLKVYFYKNKLKNEDYINRNAIREREEESYEKNLMFKDDKRKYTCLRCKKESEICGFCEKCYNLVYGLRDKGVVEVELDDVKCNEKFIVCVKNDPEYTEKIKQSIIKDGMRNPIILDDQNRILSRGPL